MPARGKSVRLESLELRVEKEGAEALLRRAEAVALVARRVCAPGDSLRRLRNMLGMAMDRDASKPDDATAGGLLRDQAGFATVDEVVRWAERRFGPEPFKDLPKKKGRVIDVSLCEQVNTSTALSEEAMPGDLGRLRDLVRHLRGEIARLTQEKAEAEVMRRRELGSRFHKK